MKVVIMVQHTKERPKPKKDIEGVVNELDSDGIAVVKKLLNRDIDNPHK